MPRVSREQMEKNHELIMQTSARLFREHGLAGVSVADLMAAAGLTHGGFYGHFDSKDELAAAATAAAFQETDVRWMERMRHAPDKRAKRAKIAEGYLSNRHRDHSDNGCAAVALAGDVAREAADKPVRAAYTAGIESQVNILADVSDAATREAQRKDAMVQLALMLGAVNLARATRGTPLSDEILQAAREFLGARAI
jgi:TetR/AcrR family transcriptional repressor of nem operon